jgi:hypothetical protein
MVIPLISDFFTKDKGISENKNFFSGSFIEKELTKDNLVKIKWQGCSKCFLLSRGDNTTSLYSLSFGKFLL